MQHHLYERLHLRPNKNDTYTLIKEFRYRDVVVPVGYTTNGANIPRFFWSFIPPNRSDFMPAVVLHDYLTDLEDYVKADRIFFECMTDLDIDELTKYTMWYAVKIYHLIRYGTPWNPEGS